MSTVTTADAVLKTSSGAPIAPLRSARLYLPRSDLGWLSTAAQLTSCPFAGPSLRRKSGYGASKDRCRPSPSPNLSVVADRNQSEAESGDSLCTRTRSMSGRGRVASPNEPKRMAGPAATLRAHQTGFCRRLLTLLPPSLRPVAWRALTRPLVASQTPPRPGRSVGRSPERA